MKWFKHLSNAHRNPDLQFLINEWGWDWYGRWWVIVEMVAEQSRAGSTFSLQSNAGRPTNVWWLSRILQTNVRRLSKFFDFLADNSLINARLWKSKKVVSIPKLRELTDEYTGKVGRKSGQTPDKLPQEPEREGEREREREKDPMEIIPDELRHVTNFVDIWAEWVKYRQELKKKLSLRAMKRQLKFLTQQPDPVACIEQSIRNQWQGLFEVKNGKNRQGDQTHRRGYSFDPKKYSTLHRQKKLAE